MADDVTPDNADSGEEHSDSGEDEKSVERLAQRAQEMLDRVTGGTRETGGLTGKIVGAASGGIVGPRDAEEPPQDSDLDARETPPAVADSGGDAAPDVSSDDPDDEDVPGAADAPDQPSAPPTVSTEQTAVAAAAAPGGAPPIPGSGGGSGGGSGWGGGSSDDDEEKLFAELPIDGGTQIVILGLLITALAFFGGDLWSAITDDPEAPSPDQVVFDFVERDAAITAPIPVTVPPELSTDEGTAQAAPTTVAPTTTTAAPTTTTEAPATTVAETTTTESTTTTVAEVEITTMWDALTESDAAPTFALIGSTLGLQQDLEAVETEDGTPIDRTLFAPSDSAIEAIPPDELDSLINDVEAAAALVGYHFLDERLSAADLLAADGSTLVTRTGLPLAVSVEDGEVVLNGTTRVVSTDISADNGVIHVIDVVLSPPTVNQVIGLGNIEFEVNSEIITPDSQEELQKAVAFFADNPGLNASIEGHTDTDGGAQANLELSERRAEAVRDFLVANGIDAERLTTVGFGETQPILVDGVEDKAASRRIEFVVR